MRNRSIVPVLLAAVVVLFLALGGTGLPGFLGSAMESPTAAAPAGAQAPAGVANPAGLPEIREAALPLEGREVLAQIRQGGPYRYSQDGGTFGNFERILPRREPGYYREYTVRTPGETDRGARRIVAGEDGDKYYTDDHYESFRFIAEGS
ncbi:ribonuclease domain-containing protein [Pseudarthrobacter sp. NPDC058362]|uniref:ribonuclease domain-containing protein n=1 Tax=unclassified Pseudarthrobacter TaxID=2647000 RepID=UPI00364CEF43